MISFIAIGGSGTGKSTIGNFFLRGHHIGPFNTFQGVDSCTAKATTDTNFDTGVSFTDTPGIPDTNPDNTKAFYNECITAVKMEHSAIVFVFKYEKIDTAKLRTSKLLFREMNKAECMKILIINDHNKYGFNPPPDQSHYKRFADQISAYTKVNFSLVINMTSETMKEGLEGLAEFAKLRGKRLASPNLRTFDELGKWVNSLKNDTDYQTEVIAEQIAALKRAESEKQDLAKKWRNDHFKASFWQAAIMAWTTAIFGVPVCVPSDVLRNQQIESEASSKDNEIRVILDEKRKNEENLEKAMQELKEATSAFNELRKAVGA